MRIFGMDPGSTVLGWAFLDLDQRHRLTQCSHGVIEAPAGQPFYLRMGIIVDRVRDLLRDRSPNIAVVESIFLGKNASSAFKLGHIRGACIVECLRQNAEIFEASPREIKKSITGNGSCDKASMRRVLYSELGIKDDPRLPMDASDALATAYGYYLKMKTEQRWQVSEKTSRTL